MDIQELAKTIGYGVHTTKTLLDRAEFASIRPKPRSTICNGVTNEHIKRMLQIKSSSKIARSVKELNKLQKEEN